MRFRLVRSFVLLSALVPSAAAADVFPFQHASLASLIEEALRVSPELRAALLHVTAAQARIPQAGALPDPMLSVGYENGGNGWTLGADGDTGIKIAASLALPFAGKRRLAGDVEARESERLGHVAGGVRRAVVYEVRKAYADLLLARENLRLIEDQRRATRDIEELTRSRYAVGLSSQSDVLRSQAELARLDQMRLHQTGLETSAIAELNRLLGRPAGTPLAAELSLGSLAPGAVALPPVAELVARVDGNSADVSTARAALRGAEATLAFAERSRKPDFVVSSSYMERGSVPSLVTVDVGITLPLFRNKKQKQAAAEAEARRAAGAASLEATRLRSRARAEQALADLAAAVQEAEAYAKGVLLVDALAVDSALGNYQAGKVPFVSVLEAHNTLYKDRFEHADLLFHVLWHSALLDALAGEEVVR